jgi:hypothetical protein
MTQNKITRDQDGLINEKEYKFTPEGFVDWRAMIDPQFLYPNKDYFELRKQQMPASIEGLDDKQLLIMLGGIKELARLRGFTSVSYRVDHVSPNYVVAHCSIDWLGNFETSNQPVHFEDVANATEANTDSFCLKFLETIACNRAFVRCVRNFLNIHIVGADEIDKSKNKTVDISELIQSTAIPITPQGALEKNVNDKLKIFSFEDFKAHLRNMWTVASEASDESTLNLLADAKDWKSFADVPAKTARVLIKKIND